MPFRVGTVPGVRVISGVSLVALGLLVSLAFLQVGCQASNSSPDGKSGPRTPALVVAKTARLVRNRNFNAARLEPVEKFRAPAALAAVEMPKAIRGLWQMGDAPCDVPPEDSDGTLTITATGWQGYEFYGTPTTVRSISPDKWKVEGDEFYLGSQHDRVSKHFVLRRGVLTISEADYVESYRRCKGV